MLKIKETLLSRGFIDNQWLDEYITLILNNYGTNKKCGCTQKHHAIPVSSYFQNTLDFKSHRKEALEKANIDPENYVVNLKYADHVKAHELLCRCASSLAQIISNAKACELMLRILQPAIEANVVQSLETSEEIQTAYEYIRKNTEQSSGSFKYRQSKKEQTVFRSEKDKIIYQTPSNKKVRCVETGVVYCSLKEAEIANNLSKGRLNTILAGYRKQIPGLTFEYYNET